jgi:hypothetical protein
VSVEDSEPTERHVITRNEFGTAVATRRLMAHDNGTSVDVREAPPGATATREESATDHPLADAAAGSIGQAARDPVKFGIGVFTAFLAGTVALAAVAFIWLGFFPSLILAMVCVPLSVFSARMIRKGGPRTPR